MKRSGIVISKRRTIVLAATALSVVLVSSPSSAQPEALPYPCDGALHNVPVSGRGGHLLAASSKRAAWLFQAVNPNQEPPPIPSSYRWEGTSWAGPVQVDQPDGGDGPQTAFAPNKDDAWLATTFTVYQWEGGVWVRQSLPLPPLASGRAHILGVDGTSSNDVWVAATYGTQRAPIEWKLALLHFDGSAWQLETTVDVTDEVGSQGGLQAFELGGSGVFWFAGSFWNGVLHRAVVMRYDGTVKTIRVPRPSVSTAYDIAASGEHVVVVGLEYRPTGGRFSYLARLVDGGLRRVGLPPSVDPDFTDLADIDMLPAGRAWVVGRQSSGGLGSPRFPIALEVRGSGPARTIDVPPPPTTGDSTLDGVDLVNAHTAYLAGQTNIASGFMFQSCS